MTPREMRALLILNGVAILLGGISIFFGWATLQINTGHRDGWANRTAERLLHLEPTGSDK